MRKITNIAIPLGILLLLATGAYVYLRSIDWPPSEMEPNDLFSDVLGDLSEQITKCYFKEDSFFLNSWAFYRLEANSEVFAKLISSFELAEYSPSDSEYALLVKYTPHWWFRERMPKSQYFKSNLFSQDPVPPDGTHFFFMVESDKVAYFYRYHIF